MSVEEQLRKISDVIYWQDRESVIERLYYTEGKTIDEINAYLRVEDSQLMNVYKMLGMITARRDRRGGVSG